MALGTLGSPKEEIAPPPLLIRSHESLQGEILIRGKGNGVHECFHGFLLGRSRQSEVHSFDTIQGLWTAAHYHIDAIFVIFNNSSYRILKQRLHAMRGLAEQADSYVGMELTDPRIDFVGLARSLGIKAERARTVHEATDLLAKALKEAGAMLIDVELDRAFKPM